MTYSPNMAVIARIARTPSIPRPQYDVDRHGEPITEETPDRKPYNGVRTGRRCQSCDRRYPHGPLCGGCWAICKKLDAEGT